MLAVSFRAGGFAAPQWHFDLAQQPKMFLSQFLDDPRWIAMLAAMLTVLRPRLPARAGGTGGGWCFCWRSCPSTWPAVSAVVPAGQVTAAWCGLVCAPARALARSLLSYPRRWRCRWKAPCDGLPRIHGHRRAAVGGSRVAATCSDVRPMAPPPNRVLYSPNQRSGGAVRQLWRKFALRGGETAPFHASMRRVVEHCALMAVAIAGHFGLANTTPLAVTLLDRGWTLYATLLEETDPDDAGAQDLGIAENPEQPTYLAR